jgi:hypothetical protein
MKATLTSTRIILNFNAPALIVITQYAYMCSTNLLTRRSEQNTGLHLGGQFQPQKYQLHLS